VRLPRECYPFLDAIEISLPGLRPAQRRGLALWVYGAVLAGSACQAAVVLALVPAFGSGAAPALRQALREWLYAGVDKAAPCRSEIDVTACFAPLLRWVLRWWRGEGLALALDATFLRDQLVVLSVSVLYRGTAIPVAWHVMAANRPGAWLGPTLGLLERLAPAVPAGMPVLLLADRGLWSGRVWDRLHTLGWHPLLRVRPDATFRPVGHQRVRAATLVPGPGHAWVGAGTAFKHRAVRRDGTLIVCWQEDQAEPWLVLTDLAPEAVGVCWYGLRVWVELDFRALKRFGWRWERTRRTDPDRVARHWLVLAVATLWVVATGTREEDAERLGRAPATLRTALPLPPGRFRRAIGVFVRGLARLRWQLLRTRRLWAVLWLQPDPWPEPPPGLAIVVVTLQL
jgi:hypothetical protein